MMARMQKAMAVMQFKLEAQLMERHPEYHMQHRALMQNINLERGTVRLDGQEYPLTDTALPTFDPQHPTALSPEETACLDRLRRSFLESQILWEQMRYVAHQGSSYLIRDNHLIFTVVCLSTSRASFYPCWWMGCRTQGKPCFEALNTVVHRAFRQQAPG
jgi:fructose-1,6-bisphosphatase-3